MNYLTRLVAGEPDGSSENRRSSERIVPSHRLVTLTTGAGATCMGPHYRDLGTTGATIARVFEGGLAARFATPIDGVFDVSIRF